MKFELVEPSDENAATEPRRPAPADQGTAGRPLPPVGGVDETFFTPVRERRAKAVEGVRASLASLRAQVAEQNMARAHRDAVDASANEAGAGFHPRRFTPSPREDDR